MPKIEVVYSIADLLFKRGGEGVARGIDPDTWETYFNQALRGFADPDGLQGADYARQVNGELVLSVRVFVEEGHMVVFDSEARAMATVRAAIAVVAEMWPAEIALVVTSEGTFLTVTRLLRAFDEGRDAKTIAGITEPSELRAILSEPDDIAYLLGQRLVKHVNAAMSVAAI